MSLLLAFEPRDHRGLDGDLNAEGDRRRTRLGRSAAEDGGGQDFLAPRGMGAPSPRLSRGGSPGEESLTSAIAVQAIEASPAFGQIKPK